MLAHLSTGQEAAALRDFNPANVGSGVKTGKSQTEQMFSVCSRKRTSDPLANIHASNLSSVTGAGGREMGPLCIRGDVRPLVALSSLAFARGARRLITASFIPPLKPAHLTSYSAAPNFYGKWRSISACEGFSGCPLCHLFIEPVLKRPAARHRARRFWFARSRVSHRPIDCFLFGWRLRRCDEYFNSAVECLAHRGSIVCGWRRCFRARLH